MPTDRKSGSTAAPTPGQKRAESGELGRSSSELPSPGDVIAAKYEVERVLGEGGMGIVVAARHAQLGQRVAIKFMRQDASLDPSGVGRFLREARAAAALSSEHVTKVVDVGTLESGAPYIVMEYLAGTDLGAVLHGSGPFAIADAVDAVLQACVALAEAHSVGIVHRDLKPANLFVTRRIDGTPLIKVLDFGISKWTELNAELQGQDLTASGSVIGSPGYMSPEQVRNAKAADSRSDVWSLGVIIYELVTGSNPFVGDTLGETFARIVSESPPSLRSARPDVPAGLADVIAQCLERPVAKRVQSVDELAVKLAPFGGEDSGAMVQRIGRITRGSSFPTGATAEALMTPAATAQPPTLTALETGTAGWLRSAARRAGSSASRLRLAWVAVGLCMGLALAGLAIGVRSARGPLGASGSPSAGLNGPILGPSAAALGSLRPSSMPTASALENSDLRVESGDAAPRRPPLQADFARPASAAGEPRIVEPEGLPPRVTKALPKPPGDSGAPVPRLPPTGSASGKKSPYDDL
jgi:eukaryotic-like serine/threonine-protein kinase